MKWFEKVKHKLWFQIAIALCLAIFFYFVVKKIGWIWSLIEGFLKIISPIIWSVILAYVVDPLVRVISKYVFRKVKKRQLARTLAIIVSIILVLAAVVALLAVLIPELVSSIEGLLSNISTYVSEISNWLTHVGNGIFASFIDKEGLNNLGNTISDFLTSLISGGDVWNASISVGSGLINLVITFVLSIYFLLAKERLVKATKKLFLFVLKKKKYGTFETICADVNKIFVRYVWCMLLDAVIIGAVNAIVMAIFGMPYIPIVSVIVGVANLVPTFGPIVGCVIGAFLLVLVNPLYALYFVILTIVLQIIDAYILKPKLFSGTLGVSALLILISIVVLGGLFGVIGMLLAIPVAAIIQYIVKMIQDKRNSEKNSESEAEDDNTEIQE